MAAPRDPGPEIERLAVGDARKFTRARFARLMSAAMDADAPWTVQLARIAALDVNNSSPGVAGIVNPAKESHP